MSYTPTVYINNQSPPISATNLNKTEQGLKDAHDLIATLSTGENPQGEFTPTGGTEYPSAPQVNDSWYIGGVAVTGYLYVAGDLAGKTANNMDKIIYTASGWSLINVAFEAPINYGFKNAIINGDFPINQYDDIDTAPVVITSGNYYIDRSKTLLNISLATIQRLTSVLVNGRYVNSIKLLASVTETAVLGSLQVLENTYKGETKTLGIWVKSNNANARISIYDGVTETISSPHSGGGSYEFLKVTKTISSSTTSLTVRCVLMSSTGGNTSIAPSDYIESTMWQLESGSVATPFEQRPIGLELSLCERYYKSFATGNNGYLFTSMDFIASTAFRNTIDIDMRDLPSLEYTFGDWTYGTAGAPTSLSIYVNSINRPTINLNGTGFLSTETGSVRNTSGVTAYVAFNAEL